MIACSMRNLEHEILVGTKFEDLPDDRRKKEKIQPEE